MTNRLPNCCPFPGVGLAVAISLLFLNAPLIAKGQESATATEERAEKQAAEKKPSAKKIELFNGKDLAGWEGDPKLWSVQDGQIVGSTIGTKIESNTFLIYQGGEFADFRLQFKARLAGDNNSGVQYRSQVTNPKMWAVAGYQMDIHANPPYTAMLFGEGTGRHIIALRGQKMEIEEEKVESPLKEGGKLKPIDLAKWHQYTIEARGNRLVHKLDGKVTVDVTDNHKKKCDRGVIALQVHQGKPMTVWFKDILLEPLDGSSPSRDKPPAESEVAED
ncbi:3-keto-disaccharide hydrolase [Adhaeretor mobilis]|uniref:3-keto-alpha-glucoside-1,2-lyase/3-keto-2-hydroxy-glucal hydratase domain-containing protein n=1 Tax=Adhaeretor mobilis TaxID=1930276 RepID=A0A517MTU3_9BACT|nr:DUF1080 domain-containing protein [Adhaeretor mobilis]QDS98299.1 hypothetical protein HG15A2_15720 [Adhaeretor mobilis]